MRQVLSNPLFEGALTYAAYHDSTDYVALTIQATAQAITTTVFVDALSKAQVEAFSVGLHRLGAQVKKVRGVRKEETSALLRLADSLCGFIRSALEGNQEYARMLKKASEQGYIRELG